MGIMTKNRALIATTIVLVSAITVLILLFRKEPDAPAYNHAHENENRPFWTHGRLRAYNGTPTFRLWVTNTHRLFGLHEEADDYPVMPKPLRELFFGEPQLWGTDIYADYLVEPLASDEKGTMRPVKILSARNLVILRDGKPADSRSNP